MRIGQEGTKQDLQGARRKKSVVQGRDDQRRSTGEDRKQHLMSLHAENEHVFAVNLRNREQEDQKSEVEERRGQKERKQEEKRRETGRRGTGRGKETGRKRDPAREKGQRTGARTSSAISMLAPSMVPMIKHAFIANFMLDVPLAWDEGG